MKKEVINIKGMHCRSCEILIEDELMKVPNVKNVKVSHRKGTAEVYHKSFVDCSQVEAAVARAGYSVGTDERVLISKNPKEYRELGIAFLIVVGLYFVARGFGLFNLSVGGAKSFDSLPIVFLIGLTAGVSTCMALVGGLILGASAEFAKTHPEASALDKFKPHLFFNLGRIISYALFGAVIGYAGSVFQLSSSFLGLLTIFVGLVMMLLGVQLTEIFPVLKSVSFTLPTWVSRRLGIKQRKEQEYSHKNSVVMGALSFFLPCGFTQAMQLYAMSTGSPWIGSLTLGTFALGTAPGLLGVGGITSVVKGTFARLFFKSAGVAVIGMAIFSISNGLNLTGFSINDALSAFSSSVAGPASEGPQTTVVSGKQIISMSQYSSGYSPNVFTVKSGIPVKWIIDSKDAYSCASSLMVPKLNIRKSLSSGENIVEFTPTEPGSIKFSCSMGMYRGTINVVSGEDAPAINPGTAGSDSGAKNSNSSVNTLQKNEPPAVSPDVQIIKLGYTQVTDITPRQLIISTGKPVRFVIEPKEDGQGCMGSVTIPGLTEKVELIEKDVAINFDVTAGKPGTYYITCGMGVPRAQITAL